jgi:uncharacterized protein YkwD
MKKLIILVAVTISNIAISQIEYNGSNLKTVSVQQTLSTRNIDSIRITKNILMNTKLIDSLNQLIINEINEIRKQHNLTLVQRIKSKDAACQTYAKQMYDDNAIGHYSDDVDAVWEICYAAADIELSFSNLKNVAKRQVNVWMASPGHRTVILGKNLDNTSFTQIAIGQYLNIVNQVTLTPIISNRIVVRFF